LNVTHQYKKELAMQNLSYSFRVLGIISTLLVMGTFVGDAHAADKKSPLRGRWSASQVSYINSGFGNTTTAVAAFIVDDQGGLTGHGTINSVCTVAGPNCPAPNPIEADFSGAITANEDGTAAMAMTLVFPRITVNVDRTCVLIGKKGDCYQEFHCINTSPNGEVVLLEVKRQLAGTCQ
jgi:hypothetical protein